MEPFSNFLDYFGYGTGGHHPNTNNNTSRPPYSDAVQGFPRGGIKDTNDPARPPGASGFENYDLPQVDPFGNGDPNLAFFHHLNNFVGKDFPLMNQGNPMAQIQYDDNETNPYGVKLENNGGMGQPHAGMSHMGFDPNTAGQPHPQELYEVGTYELLQALTNFNNMGSNTATSAYGAPGGPMQGGPSLADLKHEGQTNHATYDQLLDFMYQPTAGNGQYSFNPGMYEGFASGYGHLGLPQPPQQQQQQTQMQQQAAQQHQSAKQIGQQHGTKDDAMIIKEENHLQQRFNGGKNAGKKGAQNPNQRNAGPGQHPGHSNSIKTEAPSRHLGAYGQNAAGVNAGGASNRQRTHLNDLGASVEEIDSLELFPDSIKQIMDPSVRDLLAKKAKQLLSSLRANTGGAAGGMLGPGAADSMVSSRGLMTDLLFSTTNSLGLSSSGPAKKKIGTLTADERRVKIEKYLQKRKKRTWNRKVSYDCRKRVADSRLRVKGRFVTKVQAASLLGVGKSDLEHVSMPEIKALLHEKFGPATSCRKRNHHRKVSSDEGLLGKDGDMGENGGTKGDDLMESGDAKDEALEKKLELALAKVDEESRLEGVKGGDDEMKDNISNVLP